MKKIKTLDCCNEELFKTEAEIIVYLNDESTILVKNNGNRYAVEAVENEKLFDYMQACKTNVRQKHKKLHNIVKCFNDSLENMIFKHPSDNDFKQRLQYKPKTIFRKRDYSDFNFNKNKPL